MPIMTESKERILASLGGSLEYEALNVYKVEMNEKLPLPQYGMP